MSFTVYKSSAGSGKTYTLVREYLKLVISDPGCFRNILAVTFTNKAAGEMKSRVLRYLQEIQEGRAPAYLLKTLIRDTGLGEQEVRDRSSGVLNKILHHYSDFAIGTIDSFSHRIIRSFAHDFSLPANFRVETDSETLLETAVSLLLDRAGDDEQLTSILVSFLEGSVEDEKGWELNEPLMQISRLLLKEESQEHLPALRRMSYEDFRTAASFIRNKIRSFEGKITSAASEAIQIISSEGIVAEAFFHGSKGIFGYFSRLAAGNPEKTDINSFAAETLQNDRWTSGKASVRDTETIQRIKSRLTDLYGTIRAESDANLRSYILCSLLEPFLYPLAVLNSIDGILQEFKKQNNIIHISEFNQRIARIVMGETVPFIYERIGEKYRHILIDEFQDTSSMQWQNFVPLIENSLAGGYFNLVVGDGKQAIYRWRNGDVEQFTMLPALRGGSSDPILRDREKALQRNFREENLTVNYRSGQEIVSFNNDFFGWASGILDEKRRAVYDKPEQTPGENKEGGFVGLYFKEKSGNQSGNDMLPDVMAKIRSCLGSGYNYRDLAILCRKNHEAAAIARFLVSEGIPVVSGESLLLSYSSRVMLLTGLADQIFGSPDMLVQAEVLYHSSLTLPESSSFFGEWIRLPATGDAREKMFCQMIRQKIDADECRMLPAYEFFIKLVRIFLPGSAGDPYVQFFLDAVHGFSREHSSSVPDFLEYWAEKAGKHSVRIPGNLNAIQVMTIHKAKGLEFPVVIYPFASDELDLARSYLWIDLNGDEVPGMSSAIVKAVQKLENTDAADVYREEKEKAVLDLINLLYVAMTRARERLYVFTTRPAVSTASMNSIPAFLRGYLEHIGLWEDGKNDYCFGHESPSQAMHEETEKEARLAGLDYLDWTGKIRIRQSAPEIWDLEDPERNRRFGNLIHTILSKVGKDSSPEEIIGRLQETGCWPEVNPGVEEILEKVNKILNAQELEFIFKPRGEVRYEAEILTPSGHTLRPDRVITQEKKAILVDYKTGRPREKYREQLEQYAACLKEMGYEEVDKYLLYLEPEVRLVSCN